MQNKSEKSTVDGNKAKVKIAANSSQGTTSSKNAVVKKANKKKEPSSIESAKLVTTQNAFANNSVVGTSQNIGGKTNPVTAMTGNIGALPIEERGAIVGAKVADVGTEARSEQRGNLEDGVKTKSSKKSQKSSKVIKRGPAAAATAAAAAAAKQPMGTQVTQKPVTAAADDSSNIRIISDVQKPVAGKSGKSKSPIKSAVEKTAAKKTIRADKIVTEESGSVSSSRTPQTAVVRAWTPRELEAACIIQRTIRSFLSRRALARRKREKEEYLELMEKLEREAYVRMVKSYQEQMEKERKKEEEERRKRLEMVRRQKQMLASAFDGDLDGINVIVDEVRKECNAAADSTVAESSRSLADRRTLQIIDCEDANGNTPLSESSAGGHAHIIQRLIELGAEPNSRGRFSRTPLYRAAFAGHMEAVQTLLRNGADPRLYAEDGQTPAQVCSFDPVSDQINNWDIEMTDRLLGQLEAGKQARKQVELKRVEAETDRLQHDIERAESDYKMRQKKLCKSSGELEKRLREHDLAANSGFERLDITEQTIKEAEKDLELVREEVEWAREKLANLKLQFRETRASAAAGGMVCGEESTLSVKIRELDDVLMRDVGNRIKDSGKWPLLIDTSGRAAMFLRYRDTNYVNALSPLETKSENVRLSLLGSLRYGKPFVLDMMEVDMFDALTSRFNEVQSGLFAAILDKSILAESWYSRLLRSTDSSEYGKNQFTKDRLDRFLFVIVTKNTFPSKNLLQTMYTICVEAPM